MKQPEVALPPSSPSRSLALLRASISPLVCVSGEYDVISVVHAEAQQRYSEANGQGALDDPNGMMMLMPDRHQHPQHQQREMLRLCVHNCQMHPDMKRMYHKACWFPSSRAYDESASNSAVFEDCAAPLVRVVGRGGRGHPLHVRTDGKW